MPQLNTIEQLNACGFHTPQLYGIMCIYNYYIYTVHNFTYICIYTNVIQFPYF